MLTTFFPQMEELHQELPLEHMVRHPHNHGGVLGGVLGGAAGGAVVEGGGRGSRGPEGASARLPLHALQLPRPAG